MTRQPEKPKPRFFTVVSNNPYDGLARAEKLQELSRPTRGRPRDLDALRASWSMADLYSPRPRDQWRRTKTKGRTAIVPMREAPAANALIGVLGPPGRVCCDDSPAASPPSPTPPTIDNATRMIEQARRFNDELRGILPVDRQTINSAHEIVGFVGRSLALGLGLTSHELSILEGAELALHAAAALDKHDRVLLGRTRAILARRRGI